MEKLIDELNRFLANTYLFYLKAHFYHWNVKGPGFPMYHEHFGDIYEEVYDSIDLIAEFIRQFDGIPHNAPSLLRQNSDIEPATTVVPALEMYVALYKDAESMVSMIGELAKLSDSQGAIGLSDFLTQRHAAFKKHSWMLKSTISRDQ